MKSILITAAAVVGFTGAAWAGGPTLMSDDQMDQVVAGGTVALGQGTAALEGLFPDNSFPGFQGNVPPDGPAAAPDSGADCPTITVNGVVNRGC